MASNGSPFVNIITDLKLKIQFYALSIRRLAHRVSNASLGALDSKFPVPQSQTFGNQGSN